MPRKRRVVIASALLAFGAGLALSFASNLGEAAVFALAIVVVFFGLFGVFYWIQIDRQERGLRRSASFNFALTSFALVVAPVYLYRTRAPGRRVRAIVLFLLAMLIGWQALFLSGAIVGVIMKALFAN